MRTLEEALAYATELGHDMDTKPVMFMQTNRGISTSYVCNNGSCWAVIEILPTGEMIGDALVDACQHAGQYAREKAEKEQTHGEC